jgi:signal transduction histidine kinase
MGVLVRMCEALNSSDERWEGFAEAVRILRRAMGAKWAPSFLLDDSGARAVLVTDPDQREVIGERWPWIPARVHVRDPWIDPAGRPVAVADNLDSDGWRVVPAEFKTWFDTTGVVVAAHAQGRHLGAVLMTFGEEIRIDPEMGEFLTAAGHILGRAVHSGIVARRQQELGALKERREMADELHVDLAQQVAALGLHAEAANLDLAEGNSAALAADVRAVGDMVATLKVALRHQMMGLRAEAAAADEGCLAGIEAQAEAFRRVAPVALHVECADPERARDVPAGVSAQLMRVLQEALSNAWIHSAAANVRIRLTAGDRRARLEIEDDGRGFDLATVPDTRLGTVIMRERMAAVGGNLAIHSAPGRGTLVVAEAPLRVTEGWIALTERIGIFA